MQIGDSAPTRCLDFWTMDLAATGPSLLKAGRISELSFAAWWLACASSRQILAAPLRQNRGRGLTSDMR